MNGSRDTAERIISISKDYQVGLGTKELCRSHRGSDATFNKWQAKFGGMKVSDAQKLKALEASTCRNFATISSGVCRLITIFDPPFPNYRAGPFQCWRTSEHQL